LQGFLLQVEVSKIIMHEADEPNAVVDLLDAEFLAGQHGRDVDSLAMQAKSGGAGAAIFRRVAAESFHAVAARDDLQFLTNVLQHFSNQQVVGQKRLNMMLTVTRRVFVHGSCGYSKNCREFDVVTEQNGRIVKYFQLNGRGGGGRGSLAIEVKCRFLAGAAGLGRRLSRLGGL
jgi:hypothetical protein